MIIIYRTGPPSLVVRRLAFCARGLRFETWHGRFLSDTLPPGVDPSLPYAIRGGHWVARVAGGRERKEIAGVTEVKALGK